MERRAFIKSGALIGGRANATRTAQTLFERLNLKPDPNGEERRALKAVRKQGGTDNVD
jgi:hypothetical protein